jgi:hypothetical protein
MANRTLYVGDTFPPLRFSLTAGSRTLDLTQATSIVVHAQGADRSFSGNGTPLSPFQTDPSNVITTSSNGLNMGATQYNLLYTFAPGDTATPEVFDNIFVIVQWAGNEGQQTFVTTDTLTVLTP